MKVVVLAGPESSGKSWLSALLQQRFGGVLVGEYVRYFIEQNPRDTCLADIPAIAAGQLQWEDQARAQQPELLILDTHLLSNILWSQTLFGDCPAWLEPELLSRHYDLHLLLSPMMWSGYPTASVASLLWLNVRRSSQLAASGWNNTGNLCKSLPATGKHVSNRLVPQLSDY